MFTKYISMPLFLSSFILGLVFIYFWGPESKVIHKYPSPANYKTILYKDKVDQCYQFKPLVTNCPINPFDVKTIPIQE